MWSSSNNADLEQVEFFFTYNILRFFYFYISLCRDECRELPLSPDHWHHDWEPESDQWEREFREAQSGGPGRKWTSSKNWRQRRPAEGCLEQIKYKSWLKVVPESIWKLHVGFKCTWASKCSCITFAKIIKMFTKSDNQKVSKCFLSSWLLFYNLTFLLWKVSAILTSLIFCYGKDTFLIINFYSPPS